MARKKQNSLIKKPPLHPAQLWIGPDDILVNKAIQFLQELFCPKQGCKKCHICLKVEQKQHHAVLWFYPAKQYTIDNLQGIFSTISFVLQPNEHVFFVLQKADFLTPACANKLLKPIEEPPPGYHFILLAQRNKQILPTIRSRCITTSLYANQYSTLHPELFAYFTEEKCSPSAFLKTLDQSAINERESQELLDALLQYWITQYKDQVNQKNNRAQYIIKVLQNAQSQPPMPGSSKIFWKNIFLQIMIQH